MDRWEYSLSMKTKWYGVCAIESYYLPLLGQKEQE